MGSLRLQGASIRRGGGDLLRLARAEIIDAREVLDGGGLHPEAVQDLVSAERLIVGALRSSKASARDARIAGALRKLEEARAGLLVE